MCGYMCGYKVGCVGVVMGLLFASACGVSPQPNGNQTNGSQAGGTGSNKEVVDPSGSRPGVTDGTVTVPAAAGSEDVSNPDEVVGNGTPESCTSAATIAAIGRGGVIVFKCGDKPHTIKLEGTAFIYNDARKKVVIDGGGKITLSGEGKHQILRMDTCKKELHWTTPHCNNQDHPQLTVQNITFANGNASGIPDTQNRGGGGAIFAHGGRLKVVNSTFINNHCAATGQDVGGGAIRAFAQYKKQPVIVTNSVFGGKEGHGNSCSNGGAISSIQTSWNIVNSVFTHNVATGNGGNPKKAGTPGGGSGGAIYNDGLEMTLSLDGVRIENNKVNAYGSAIFFVSNNQTGRIVIRNSTIRNNTGGSWYPNPKAPGISMHPGTPVEIVNSTLEK